MSASSPVALDEESHSQRLARKARDAPFLVVGLTGLIGAVSYGVYAFKNKGKMSTSVYLMQLRVGAQGAVVGALMLGVIYNMMNEYVFPGKWKKDN
ncbi:HIG1 domain family member 1C-like isoform X2 [Ischnura elegans]|nr:HIG1 domain family member 1C-like isoform X2 [Ischnura elegans]